MFWTFNLSLDILATVWATFPNIGRIFVQFSGHSVVNFHQDLMFSKQSGFFRGQSNRNLIYWINHSWETGLSNQEEETH